MASQLTNRGLKVILNSFFRGEDTPASFRMALLVAQPIDRTLNDINDVSQIVSGNGYTTVNGATGKAIARDGTGWDTITLVDSLAVDYAFVQMINLQWITTGIMPASGLPIRWLAICDAASPNNLIAFVDMIQTHVVASGHELTFANITIVLVNL